MTTSVYKPIGFPLCRNVDRKMFCRPGIQKAKRALFEVDHEATQKFLQEELEKITVNESERWNFDFKQEQTLNPNGNFIWQAVGAPRKINRGKRPHSPNNIEHLYAQPEIIRPKAIKPSKFEDSKSKLHATHQKSIKDYMCVKRQISTESKKSSDWDRPSKLIKLTNQGTS
ncbi:unnamed protein product [Brassicogethes aeneus]|uniref:Cyclin-dependent kinase inhibitor domain-containing protein n=1 Tax=Brassicogethes aeneus TaxID=1431903 RepID=A0A9P0BDE0_BRAAE|nr:unnamed protein product [Brassicogethes aeneus]